MKCVIYADNTLPLAVEPLVKLLNQVCKVIAFSAGSRTLRIERPRLSCPSSYRLLPADLLAETSGFDLAFLCTNVPYDNNYFFDSTGAEVLISFSGWNLLTELPVANGLAYFIASIVCNQRAVGKSHRENTGCINDFWWDKRGIDVGMRAAFVCRKCFESYRGNPGILADIQALLDLSVRHQGKGRIYLVSRQGWRLQTIISILFFVTIASISLPSGYLTARCNRLVSRLGSTRNNYLQVCREQPET